MWRLFRLCLCLCLCGSILRHLQALVFGQQLTRRMCLKKIDDEIDALVISLCGLGVHVHVGRDITDQLAPRLSAGPTAIDAWIDRLTRDGVAMVRAEAARRGVTLKEQAL